MSRPPFRAHGPTELRHDRALRSLAAVGLASLGSCASYEPAPVELGDVLAELRAARWEPADAEAAAASGAELAELASFAVTHDPALRAARARIGVARALLVEAGLLEDPTLGWDGMDALASQLVEGTTSTVDFVSGIGISIPLPRPGELDARTAAARWRAEEARRQVLAAEWALAREVHLAGEAVRGARRLLAENDELVHVAETTRDYFARARAAGAATAIQANLATGDLLAIRARRLRLEAELRDAEHRLDALLGLPPATRIPLANEPEALPEARPAPPEVLVERALSLRPDLAVLLAAYRAAEEDVRLAVARQLPALSVGTGFTLVPGFATRFGRAAIETAEARRAVLRAELRASVHSVRAEIHDAHAAVSESRREVEFLERELLPNAEESLRLAAEAFDAGEVTLLEILDLQRALVDARTRTTEARTELQKRHWRLAAAGGALLAAGDDPETSDEPEPPQP